jgi:hypothetical protein
LTLRRNSRLEIIPELFEFSAIELEFIAGALEFTAGAAAGLEEICAKENGEKTNAPAIADTPIRSLLFDLIK